MVGKRVYDWMYRVWAPWDAVGIRTELRGLVESGRVTPQTHQTAIDLGCGTGANVVYLAEQGFDATGVDFSPVALDKARARAVDAGVADAITWVEGDLLADHIDGLLPTYDLLVDFGVLDDFQGEDRARMAATIRRLSHPGSEVVFWCFHAARSDLPLFSMEGPSRLYPGLEPHEVGELFADDFDIERLPEPPPSTNFACFLLTRHGGADPSTN